MRCGRNRTIGIVPERLGKQSQLHQALRSTRVLAWAGPAAGSAGPTAESKLPTAGQIQPGVGLAAGDLPGSSADRNPTELSARQVSHFAAGRRRRRETVPGSETASCPDAGDFELRFRR